MTKGHKETLAVNGYVHYFHVLMISQVCAYIKAHQILYCKDMQFIECQFYTSIKMKINSLEHQISTSYYQVILYYPPWLFLLTLYFLPYSCHPLLTVFLCVFCFLRGGFFSLHASIKSPLLCSLASSQQWKATLPTLHLHSPTLLPTLSFRTLIYPAMHCLLIYFST